MLAMETRVCLSAPDLNEEEIQGLTLELCRELNREMGVHADLPVGRGPRGGKGDPVTIGTVILTFMTSGAAVGLIKIIESYLSRRSSLEVELQRPDGKKMVIRGQDIRPDQVERTADLARDFFEE
jgi:hypothetical protein